MVISNLMELSGHIDEVELVDSGCIVINSDKNKTELIIDKLINNKTKQTENVCDFLIHGTNGTDAPDGSGENGTDGVDGGKIHIKVKDLVNDVRVKVKGTNGGNGGSGVSYEKTGGNGGNGGNGGDGPSVFFEYGHIGKLSTGIPSQFKWETGCGGNGGDGGSCTEPVGNGGTKDSAPTIGGKNGNGGKAGKAGKAAEWQTSYLKNDNELKKPLDLSNEDEYNYFVSHFGGEEQLKKYPEMWKAIQNNRLRKSFVNDEEPLFSFDDTASNASLLGDSDSSNGKMSSASDYFKFQINNVIVLKDCEQTDSKEEREKKKHPEFVSCLRSMMINGYGMENDEPITIWQSPSALVQTDYISQISDVTETDYFSADLIRDFNFKISIAYIYLDADGVSYPVLSNSIVLRQTKILFYNYTKIIEPCYNPDRHKTPGEDIMFLYGRDPDQNPDWAGADYYGGVYKALAKEEEGGRKYFETTIIPVKGEIYFEEDPEFYLENIQVIPFKGKSPVGFEYNAGVPRLSYSNNQYHTIVSYGQGLGLDASNLQQAMQEAGAFEVIPYSSDKTKWKVSFNFCLKNEGQYTEYGRYDWQSKLEDSGFFGDDYIKNDCLFLASIMLRLKYRKKEGGDYIYDDLQIWIEGKNGKLPDDNPNYFVSSHNKATVYIPRFVIAWGCYAADTLINTVDGTKKACEIRRGDRLPVYGGKVLTISSVMTGNDRAIFRITTTDGRSIRVSGGHAMKMYSEKYPNGKKIAAAKLKKGDRLMTPDNVVEISSVEIEEYNDKVYNFTFEEEHSSNYIMANGFWSGDFKAQNEPEFCEIPEKTMAIINDMKQYVNDMKNKPNPLNV